MLTGASASQVCPTAASPSARRFAGSRTTTKPQGCRCPALGARVAVSRSRRTTSSPTGSARKRLTMRRCESSCPRSRQAAPAAAASRGTVASAIETRKSRRRKASMAGTLRVRASLSMPAALSRGFSPARRVRSRNPLRSMSLLERLLPRWRHADPDVRAAAAREMGPEDRQRLAHLAATDDDVRVRRIAIKKLDDAGVLERLAASDPDQTLRELAGERALEVLIACASSGPAAECERSLERLSDQRGLTRVAMAAEHETIRRAALARVSSERSLRDVARGAADPAIRRQALARIRDWDVLRTIAVGDGPPDVALEAVDRIGDAETLRAIADTPSASKAVRQRARSRLSEDADAVAAVGVKEGHARQLDLCTAVQALRAESDVLRAAARVREAAREWERLAARIQPREDVSQRFAAACEAILADADVLERRREEVERARLAEEENLAAREELCAHVEALDAAGAPQELARARSAWRAPAPLSGEHGAALERRFALACDEAEARHRRHEAADARRARLEAVVAEAEALATETPVPPAKAWRAVERRWNDLASGEARDAAVAELSRRLADAGARLASRRRDADERRAEEQQANLARLDALCTKLGELAAAEALKPSTARKTLGAADAALADLGPLPPAERRAAWTERLTERRDELLRRVRREEETEEWRRWANTAAQEDIIRRIEALLEANDLAEGTRVLGRLQDEWAEVSTASPDRAQ